MHSILSGFSSAFILKNILKMKGAQKKKQQKFFGSVEKELHRAIKLLKIYRNNRLYVNYNHHGMISAEAENNEKGLQEFQTDAVDSCS